MKRISFIILLLFILASVKADFWDDPKVENYFSNNGEYLLTVYPTQIPKKYFAWLHTNPKKKQKFSATDTTIVHCYAILYKIVDNHKIEVWNKQLMNRSAPVEVIISNDGKFVITFDNWHEMGYGVNVMVCYDEKGNLSRRYSLENISPFPINDYFFSVSSIVWRCGVNFISNQTIEICFIDRNKNSKKLIYDLIEQTFKDLNEEKNKILNIMD